MSDKRRPDALYEFRFPAGMNIRDVTVRKLAHDPDRLILDSGEEIPLTFIRELNPLTPTTPAEQPAP